VCTVSEAGLRMPSFVCTVSEAGLCMPSFVCTVSEAGLRGLEGLFLVSVSRLGKVIHAVGPEFILQEGGSLGSVGGLLLCGCTCAAALSAGWMIFFVG